MKIEEYIAAAQNTKEKKYWLNKLYGELTKNYFYYDATPKNNNARSFEKEKFAFTGELFSKFIQLSSNSDLRLHMVLTAGLLILIQKYTGEKDIMIGMPIYKEGGEEKFINTAVVFRDFIDPAMTFKEILFNVRQTIIDAVEHANYPVELLAEQLGMPASKENDFPLFDIVILLENIHDKKYVEHLNYNITFSLDRKENSLEGIVEYNINRYYQETIKKIISYYQDIFQQVLFDVNLKVSQVDIIPEVEKRKLLNEFNSTGAAFPNDKTIPELFEEQVERTPGNIAVCSPVDYNDIFTPTSCFKKNPYIFECELGMQAFELLKTNSHDSVVINKNMRKLFDCFTGENNLESVFAFLKDYKAAKFIIFTAQMKDILGISHEFNRQADVFSNLDYDEFISLVQLLHKNNLIKFHGFKSPTIMGEKTTGYDFNNVNESFDNRAILKDLLTYNEAGFEKADVLLLGDSQGMPTTGLLYLASFLRRNGVIALCRFYDDTENFQDMTEDIEKMLGQIQPRVVGISLKWFLYIARVVDMCKIIKEYSRRHGVDIKVVVGGNTASYYWQEIMKYDDIDYLVRGDGEEPLLKIVRGEKNIPNCVYRENGKIIENPITYIQDEKNSTETYLSHLDQILLDKYTSFFGTFFIYTQKGCAMNCLYCGGCHKVQQIAFNRKNVLRRNITEVRKDINAVKKYVSTLYFEFDIIDKNLTDYCQGIWEGIDLSGHFCLFNTLTPPSIELVELVSRTFKYVYWDYDICTPSERHRKQLESLGLVKPQPTDAEIMDFLSTCEKFKNIEVRPNLITGLPYFTSEDIESGKKLLTEIMSSFSCFSELHWARLHAQPGAPILEYADQVQMHSFATSFEEFLECSAKTFNRSPDSGYVSVENFNYPYIYFNDDHLNSQVTKFYLEINQKVNQHKNDRANDLFLLEKLTYKELNERADRLAAALISRGVTPGDIVGLMIERSVAIPVGILGILKCGAAYLPVDPEFPTGRIAYMLKDSGAKILIKKSEIRISKSETNPNDQNRNIEDLTVLNLDHLDFKFVSNFGFRVSGLNPSHLAYIIYTSGTTGKPKGVAIKHENLVNYVYWFTNKVRLTDKDKTLLATSFAFDLGYTSLYNSLLNGCELHILPREIYLLAERLLNYIKQNEITFIKVTPSLFSVMVNSPAFSKITCQTLRLVAMGGEPINVNNIEKAHSICSHLTIMNHYGPTETTIGCAAEIIDFADFEKYKVHPVIGKPIANAAIYILGKDSDLLPVGIPGELCISGVGVGVGYLNQPALTAEKFGPQITLMKNKKNKSFAGDKGGLFQKPSPGFYRTGDLARWLSNGTIEFLGRIDNQVKVRGYRIELGEIEAQLRKHLQVEEALVVVKEYAASDQYLCAYVVSNKEKQPSHAEKTEKPTFHKKTVSVKDALAQGLEEQVKKNPLLDLYAGRLAHIIREKYDDRYKLSNGERIRYKRQMLLAGWGQSAQEKLKSASIFVAGAGGGASPTVTQLALAGFGTIKICDYDEVELSNLNRQFLHNDERLGMNKALSAKITVNKINPHVNVIPYTQKLTRENISELVGDSAIIFDMFDGPADKFVLSEYAVVKQIPHLIISMTDINAYAAVLHSPHTPCYHCLFDKIKLETIISGMKHYLENYSKNPLPVVSTSLFISTGIIVNEALKILLGFEKPAYNRFFYFNQRGATDGLVFTPGYKAMTHLFSDHFLNLCREQGFDWESGWRGNFLEEFNIEPDPNCPLCGSKEIEKRKKLEGQFKKSHTPIYLQEEKKEETGEQQQIIALLLKGDSNHIVGSLGAMKSGKAYVQLDIAYSVEVLAEILEDSEARIIVTEGEYKDTAETLRDRVNKNIVIIDIGSIVDMDEARDKIGPVESPIEIPLEQMAYISYEPDSDYSPGRTNNLPEALKEYLRKELPDYMMPAYFVLLDKIPMTPNGKVDMNALPEPGITSAHEFKAPENELEEKLVEIWSKILNVENIGVDDDFFALGLDSIKAIQAAARMNKEKLRVGMNDIFLNPSIRRLSHYVKRDDITPDQDTISGKIKLTPIQKWFFETYSEENHHFNMAVMFYRKEGFDTEFIQKAFKKIIEHHDALRIVFEIENGNIIQRNRDVQERLFDLEIINLEPEEITREAERIQTQIDLQKGPLVKLGLFKTTKGDHLLIVIHHLVIDGISWRILFEDIEILFDQYQKEEKFVLPPKSTSFKHWAEKLSEYANSKKFLKEKTFWADMEAKAVLIPRLVKDFEEENFEKDNQSLSFHLNEEKTTALLTEVNQAFGTEINEILLTALGLAFKKNWGHNYLLVSMEGHGREEIIDDVFINRTIGWFTTIYPILLDMSYEHDLARQIKEVKETFRRLPNKGIGYGILRYLTADTHKKEINFQLNPQINFNYLGQFDADVQQMSAVKISNIPSGHSFSSQGKKTYDLEITGIMANKQLNMSIMFSKKQFKHETIETIWKGFENELCHIISFCLGRDEVEVTPGDFTFKGLSIEQFDNLFD